MPPDVRNRNQINFVYVLLLIYILWAMVALLANWMTTVYFLPEAMGIFLVNSMFRTTLGTHLAPYLTSILFRDKYGLDTSRLFTTIYCQYLRVSSTLTACLDGTVLRNMEYFICIYHYLKKMITVICCQSLPSFT
jgi:hypothetical protein